MISAWREASVSSHPIFWRACLVVLWAWAMDMWMKPSGAGGSCGERVRVVELMDRRREFWSVG